MPTNFPYSLSNEIRDKAKSVKLLVLDVDGVLTGGNLYFGAQGEKLKEFSILDGLGIKLLRNIGVDTAIITGRLSGMVAKRTQELGIQHVIQGREDKLVALNELLSTLSLQLSDCCYVGDDLPDLAAIQSVKLGVTPINAHPAVKDYADWVCHHQGGRGAVREVADIILESKNLYEQVIEQYSLK
jgi:3-deoxy-D-manno-octulosonate 8-phosphate phosphatase (KDO 8-P phosphatase)